ncbi:MAG: SAM-dependent methyltransferase [Aquificaceae bacterium]|nr:MAG: SAM-dependent methyltransferase [Aquificaceae bacterium]
MPLDKTHRKNIISSYNYALSRNGFHPNALLWSSKEVQELRFEKLLNIGIQTGDSVLDVGCGFGDLSAYLLKQGIKDVDYCGIDLSAKLLETGRIHYPAIILQQGDLFDYNPENKSVDYVMLSGTLNNKLGDDGAYALQVIERMFASCRKGIAFNLLDARDEWTAGRWDLQSFHPDVLKEFLSGLSTRVEILDDYLQNDFTVLVWRD